MKKFWSVLAFSVVLLLNGCGYSIGSLMHPEIKTVAIAPVGNDTLVYNIAGPMRNVLSECFMSDGSLKVTSEKNADCIVYVRIKSVNFSSVSCSSKANYSKDDEDAFLPNLWSASVSCDMIVMIPGRAKPLLSVNGVSGSATFTGGADLETSRANGVNQACYQAAKKIVSQLVEAW